LHYCNQTTNLNFGVSWTFRSRLMGQQLSDRPLDLIATLNFGGHGACQWYGFSWSICILRLKFAGLCIRKIWHIFSISISRPGVLDLLTLELLLVRFIVRGVRNIPTNFGVLW